MPVVLKSLRAMKGMGIFAERDVKAPRVEFRRYNLLYGFNGSGKTTLSRLFACFQLGERDPRLPKDCMFEVELGDGTVLACPDKLGGLERRVLVFNTDFVEQNLQWSSARANPVFYIGKEQAELADELAASRGRVSVSGLRVARAADAVKAADKDLAMFRRERARQIADWLWLRGRKYEAPQLSNDYARLDLGENSQLDDAALEAFSETCRLEDPPAKVYEIALPLETVVGVLEEARGACGVAPSGEALAELQDHPEMLVWVMQGHEYHAAHALTKCLFCSNSLSSERMWAIQGALDQGIDRVIATIDESRDDVEAVQIALDAADAPAETSLSGAHRSSYRAALTEYDTALDALKRLVAIAIALLDQKRKAPGAMPDVSALPNDELAAQVVTSLRDAQTTLNSVIRAHNEDVDDFARLQEDAHLAIRKHYLAEGKSEHDALQEAVASANAENRAAINADEELLARIQALEHQIREHGPAAEAINRLLCSYLGHAELSIVAVKNGYEIHRNGRLITGLPSEGEKTAIALCYFLSMLQSDGRKTPDLIVVMDDPISSLDSRSLNFACSLIKNRLADSAQLIMMTHNQNCFNEFRKAWKSMARAKDGETPKAALLFLDVSVPEGQTSRKSNIVDLPPLLREYDSEYHYLFHHLLRFSAAESKYPYAYMMPNVLRRILELFLAFRCPGSAPLSSKIDQLCNADSNLDRDRIVALERLTQVESHSDNLDDLISFSSMTLEESRDATNALLVLLEHVDAAHLKGLRKICS
jgi:wobble nucleotide-excising tRNase